MAAAARCAEEESQVGMHEIADVAGVNRGFGLWGDMVLQLRSGDKLEMRSVPQCAAASFMNRWTL